VKTKWGAEEGIQGAWGDWFGNSRLGSYSAAWLSIFCATQEKLDSYRIYGRWRLAKNKVLRFKRFF
jgi:hypothetical protein